MKKVTTTWHRPFLPKKQKTNCIALCTIFSFNICNLYQTAYVSHSGKTGLIAFLKKVPISKYLVALELQFAVRL